MYGWFHTKKRPLSDVTKCPQTCFQCKHLIRSIVHYSYDDCYTDINIIYESHASSVFRVLATLVLVTNNCCLLIVLRA